MENTSNQNINKIGVFDILMESLKRSGCCGSDLLKKVETNLSNQSISKGQEILILTLVPAFVLVLILVSFFLERQGVDNLELAKSIALLAIFLGGGNRFMRGFQDLFIKRKVTVDVFVTISLLATMAIGEFISAAIVIFIMAIAGAVELYALDKSRKGIGDLLNLAPSRATLLVAQEERIIDIDDIDIGDKVLLKPGERVPVDGVIVEGNSYVNQAAITGEATPINKIVGSNIFAGTLNETGRIVLEATKVGTDTTLSKIVQRVEQSQEVKAPIQKMADKFTTWYLPIVLLATLIGYIITRNIQSAVSILLVAAPCALSIGTPTAVTAGMANMTKRGVLIKGGLYFEEAGKLDAIFIDKTGTITTGRPDVVKVIPDTKSTEEEVLSLAASAEKYSDHPLAKAIVVSTIARGISIEEPKEFSSETGIGVKVEVKDVSVCVGRFDYMMDNNFTIPVEFKKAFNYEEKQSRTCIAVAKNKNVIGLISLADEIRPETNDAITELNKLIGNDKIHLLSGDSNDVAESIGRQINIQNIHGDLMPEDKEQIIREYQSMGKKVAMIGDGINDGPALSLADVGIAMGMGGSDFAIETADVVLMQDDLTKIVEFIHMSRLVIKRIRMNIVFSFAFNIIGIIIGTLGFLNPVMAILLQEAGTMAVIINSTLLLWKKV